MYDQRLNTGSCCYVTTSEIKNVMQLRQYAHQDGIAHVCVVVCLPFNNWTLADDSILWFDSSVFDEDCYFSTVKEQHRRDSNPTCDLFHAGKAFYSNSLLLRSRALLESAQAMSNMGRLLRSHLLVSSMSFPREGWTAGHGFDRMFCSSRRTHFWDEIRSHVLFTQ